MCGACEKGKAKTMLQMFGQPYNSNTLATLPPKPEAMLNRVSSSFIRSPRVKSSFCPTLIFQNFSVCEDCGTLCGLYHRLHHMKQKLYVMCSEIVEKRKEDSPGIDTTQILNQLLADDVWLETVKDAENFDLFNFNIFAAIQKDARLVGRRRLLRPDGSVIVILVRSQPWSVIFILSWSVMVSLVFDAVLELV